MPLSLTDQHTQNHTFEHLSPRAQSMPSDLLSHSSLFSIKASASALCGGQSSALWSLLFLGQDPLLTVTPPGLCHFLNDCHWSSYPLTTLRPPAGLALKTIPHAVALGRLAIGNHLTPAVQA